MHPQKSPYLNTAPVSRSYFQRRWQMSMHETGEWLAVDVNGTIHRATPQLRQAQLVLSPHLPHLSCLASVLGWSAILPIRLPVVRSQNSAASIFFLFPAQLVRSRAYGFLFGRLGSTLVAPACSEKFRLRKPKVGACSMEYPVSECLYFYIVRLSSCFASFMLRNEQTTTIPHSIKSRKACHHLLDLNLWPPAAFLHIVPWSPHP